MQHTGANQHPQSERVQGSTGNQPADIYDNSGRTRHQPYQGADQPGGPFQQDIYGQSTQAPASNTGANAGMYNNDNTGYNRPSGGGTGKKLAGKVESALGSIVGSSTLKAKGLEKERGSNVANIQALELAEAERLEREALMRRQNAGQGAHPANVGSGAGQPGPGMGSMAQPRPGPGMPGRYPQ